jgi:hypothetical protein
MRLLDKYKKLYPDYVFHGTESSAAVYADGYVLRTFPHPYPLHEYARMHIHRLLNEIEKQLPDAFTFKLADNKTAHISFLPVIAASIGENPKSLSRFIIGHTFPGQRRMVIESNEDIFASARLHESSSPDERVSIFFKNVMDNKNISLEEVLHQKLKEKGVIVYPSLDNFTVKKVEEQSCELVCFDCHSVTKEILKLVDRLPNHSKRKALRHLACFSFLDRDIPRHEKFKCGLLSRVGLSKVGKQFRQESKKAARRLSYLVDGKKSKNPDSLYL